MSTDTPKAEPIGDLRLQTLIDMHKQRYIRERGSDPNTYDVYMALVELRSFRRALAKAAS